jgi:predicted dehydrogenase
MKILIIGYGSIGKRHYRNLNTIGGHEVGVFDVNKKALEEAGVSIVEELNEENLSKFDVAFICTPNHLHIDIAQKCADAGVNLFIEKPLSHTLENTEKLLKTCEEKGLVHMVACDMRFDPCLMFIKEQIKAGKIGKVHSIRHEYGYYLPYWRPNIDYRNNYAGKPEQGGGIILDDIHEFDLLFWLNDFNKVDDHKLIFDKISDLELGTEDMCIGSFKFSNGVMGLVITDYLQQELARNCKVVGEKGNLSWDLHQSSVWFANKEGREELFNVEGYDDNQPYIDEVNYFLNCVKDKERTFNGIDRAMGLLNYCVVRK